MIRKLKNKLYPSKIFLEERQAFSAGFDSSGAGFASFMNWETRNFHSTTVTATFTKRMNQETGCIPKYRVWGMLCRKPKRGDLKKYIKGWMNTRVCNRLEKRWVWGLSQGEAVMRVRLRVSASRCSVLILDRIWSTPPPATPFYLSQQWAKQKTGFV